MQYEMGYKGDIIPSTLHSSRPAPLTMSTPVKLCHSCSNAVNQTIPAVNSSHSLFDRPTFPAHDSLSEWQVNRMEDVPIDPLQIVPHQSISLKSGIQSINDGSSRLSVVEGAGAIDTTSTSIDIPVTEGNDDITFCCPCSPSDSPVQSTDTLKRYPRECNKLMISIVFFACSGMCNDLVLSIIHEWVPNTAPLPDLIFANTTYYAWALTVSELLIVGSIVITIFVCMAHKHRCILFRRVFMILGMMYFFRSLCMLVTQLPVADPTYYCSPKLNETTVKIIALRTLKLFSGGGLSINGQHILCGDYIYSGHTVIVTLSYLVTREYSPKRYWVLHWFSFILALCGVVFLLLSRGHYTIDVILAYYICTRLFATFHTMANNSVLKERSSTNQFSKYIWFRFFQFMEKNVQGTVPKRFECPTFLCPKQVVKFCCSNKKKLFSRHGKRHL